MNCNVGGGAVCSQVIKDGVVEHNSANKAGIRGSVQHSVVWSSCDGAIHRRYHKSKLNSNTQVYIICISKFSKHNFYDCIPFIRGKISTDSLRKIVTLSGTAVGK